MPKYRRKRTNVYITGHEPIALSERKAALLQPLVDAGSKGLNTLALNEIGVLNPSKTIGELKAIGMSITCKRLDVIDSFGNFHPNVAHYTFMAYEPDKLLEDAYA